MEAFLYLIPFVSSVFSMMTENDMPAILCKCFNEKAGSITTIPGELILYTCVNKYLAETWLERYHPPRLTDPDTINWLQSLGRKVRGQEYNIRTKRQAVRRIRREIRTLTDAQRNRFIQAVQQLKARSIGTTNRYDAIASAHDGLALGSAHMGPNFPSWHREYLKLFEAALQEIDNRVTLPFFDSRLDYNLDDPKESIFWGDNFMGDHSGVVTNGPFRLWRQRNGAFLERNGGASGSMISPMGIRNVLSRRRNIDILKPWANDRFDLENYHDAVHVWVGGTMRGLNTAPSDPVFFLHHCFIDYVWEQFRQRQTVDSESDYPFDQSAPPSHAPNRIMDNLESGKKNIDGYSNDYTDQYYRYANSPRTCRQCRNRFPYLKCGDLVRGLCSATNRPQIRLASQAKSKKPVNKDLGITRKFSTTITDKRKIPPRTRRSTGDWLVYETFLEEKKVSKIGRTKRSINSRRYTKEKRTSHITNMDSTMQNSFLLDGEPDIKRWVFIPVKIVHRRPSGLLFGTKVIKNKNIVDGVDVYSYNKNMNYTDEEQQAAYSHSFTSGSGADKVYVQVDGMSYNGKYVDYTIVDSRLPVSESVAFVAVKNPKLNSSISFISAYDSHGRICRPYCHSYGSNSNQYRTCSGVVYLTEEKPKLYGEDVGEVTQLLYPSGKGTVFTRNDKNIFLSFYCDFHEIPWGKC
ncbi:tyrosinase-like protein isoform X1 [Mytilus californianus]|uniref:tyrosinase-like protein isoform X1 n=2 Tax=Mytilus californianus TaxID=6549 RepID=UPI0022465156|nr:tyrosinase-like protein isoform X1 [Mytilus californianus]XP_052087657.1 tyrosinase-like protein isoform X1 [Mytilus californianus]